MYTGPIFFHNILPKKYYEHFLLLHFAMFVFISPDYSHLYDNAKHCIDRFLLQIEDLFTLSGYTFNAHCLSHLHTFVKSHGPLDTFSTFPFENYLYMLKKRIKSGSFILTQTVNSLHLMRHLYINTPHRKLFFSASFPNNCAIVYHNHLAVPLLINSVSLDGEQQMLSGHLLKMMDNLYTYPYPSSTLGIGRFSVSNVTVNNVLAISKCVILPYNEIFIIIPFSCVQSEQ